MISQDDVNKTLTISDLKLKAKDQLLGNYGIATGSFALLFALLYAVTMVISSAISAGAVKGTSLIDTHSVLGIIGMRALTMATSAFFAILGTGYTYIMKKIAQGQQAVISDLFYVFKNHPDKVIIITIVTVVIQYILLIPATVVEYQGMEDGRRFLIWCMLYLIAIVISFVIGLYFAMANLIYLDDPDRPVKDMIAESISMMRGNAFRYFYLLLSFLGYYVLIALSLGIAALWVIPYQSMSIVYFYYDLKNRHYEG